MTKPVRDYLARCMEAPEFAEAYRELEVDYQVKHAQIQARIVQIYKQVFATAIITKANEYSNWQKINI